MHGQTALTLAGNGGKTRRPATSRASRFFGYVQKPVTLQESCGCSDSIKVGTRGTFEKVLRKNAKSNDRKRKQASDHNEGDSFVEGTVVFISYKKGLNASALNYPTKCWCPHILTAQASNASNDEDSY